MKKLTRDQLLFGLNLIAMTILFVGYILTTGLNVVDPDHSKNIFRFISAGLAIVAIVLGGRLTAPFLATIYLFVITLVASGNGTNLNLIFLAIAVQALTILTARRAAMVLFWSGAAGAAVHLLARAMGIVGSVSIQIDGRARSAAGFANANQAALIYLSLIAAAVLMHMRVGAKWTRAAVILSLLVSLPTMLDSYSRTSLFSLVIMFMLFPFIKFVRKFGRAAPLLRLGMAAAPAVAVALTFWLATSTNRDLDVMFSYRPYFFSLFLKGLSIRNMLFGWQIYDYQTIDNTYLALLSAVGAIVMVGMLIVITRLMYRVRIEEAPIVIMALIAGITESFMVRPEILLSPIFLTVLLAQQFRPEAEKSSARMRQKHVTPQLSRRFISAEPQPPRS